MIKTKYFLIAFLVFYMALIRTINADSPATPNVNLVEFPKLLIHEVGFKDSSNDFIKIKVVDSMDGSIRGLKIKDDSTFFENTDDIQVTSGEIIGIKYKMDENKVVYENGALTFYLTRSGLTGTTEQVILLNDNDEVIDAICWSNSSPTSQEIEDIEELVSQNEWSGECLNSDEVEKNKLISRTAQSDTNTKNDWEIEKELIIEEITIEEEEVESDPQVEIVEPTPEIPKCLSNIIISEVFPNPEGKDANLEWIEIFNTGDQACVLEGLLVDDQDGGSKPFKLKSHKIYKSGYLLLPSWETKINLNNGEDTVRLIHPNDEILDEIFYEDAKENESFSLLEDNSFEWTNSYTPLLPNKPNVEEICKKTVPEKSEEKEEDDTPFIVNGDISQNIHITEVFPNPKGTDKGNEWVEIHNNSTETVDLSNWILDNGESSTKKYIFTQKIYPESYLIIKELPFSLKNSEGEVRVLDFENTLVDEMNYSDVVDGESYSKSTVIVDDKTEDFWNWTDEITPGQENKSKFKFKGEILELDEVENILKLKNEDQELDLYLVEDGDSLHSQVLNPGTIIEVISSKTDNDDYIVESFEVLEIPEQEAIQEEHTNYIYLILSSVPPLGFLTFMGLKRFYF